MAECFWWNHSKVLKSPKNLQKRLRESERAHLQLNSKTLSRSTEVEQNPSSDWRHDQKQVSLRQKFPGTAKAGSAPCLHGQEKGWKRNKAEGTAKGS